MNPTLESYWAFGEQIWQLQELREAALYLQDLYSLEPNLLLLALMMQNQEEYFTEEQFKQIEQAQAKWSEQLLAPYRRLRKLAKGHLEETSYQQMLQVELDMERKCQKYILGELCEHTPAKAGDNLTACLATKDIDLTTLPTNYRQTLEQEFNLSQ